MAMPSDQDIREMAEARVAFRGHLVTYAVVNVFLVGIWWFTSYDAGEGLRGFWPIWPILGWGIGLAFHAWGAYGRGLDAVKREEEKLRAKYGRT